MHRDSRQGHTLQSVHSAVRSGARMAGQRRQVHALLPPAAHAASWAHVQPMHEAMNSDSVPARGAFLEEKKGLSPPVESTQNWQSSTCQGGGVWGV